MAEHFDPLESLRSQRPADWERLPDFALIWINETVTENCRSNQCYFIVGRTCRQKQHALLIGKLCHRQCNR